MDISVGRIRHIIVDDVRNLADVDTALMQQVTSTLNAAAIMAGSIACTQLLRRVGSRGLLTAGFAGIMIGGAGMLTQLLPGPWGLALPMAVISFSFGLSRPPSNNLILEQVDRNAGAASSLAIFIYFMLGAFSMWLIALDWTDKIYIIGVLGTAVGGIILGIWLVLPRITAGKPAKLSPEENDSV